MLEDYVCVACERNRHDICPGCACSSPEHAATPAKPRRATGPRGPANGVDGRRRNHGSWGARVEPATAHAIAVDLLIICPCCELPLATKAELAARHAVTYEQVRTVLRNLETLNGATRHSKAVAR